MTDPIRRFCAALALASAMTACASTPEAPRPSHEARRFVVVRHAEKETGAAAPADPALVEAGRQRAMRLADWLEHSPLVAVYATPYRRTHDTALPTARMHGLPVTRYDPRQPADALADSLRASHPHGTVLVVGHSNTVPAIASALCGCEVAPMNEDDYAHRYIVEVDADGQARLSDHPLP